jgi:hypothetical protein
MADLITLTELKNALGVDLLDTDLDAKYTLAIKNASAAVREYADRSFDLTTVTSTRVYEYDGSGVLEIEDATTVTTVLLDGIALQPSEYAVEPYGKTVLNWIFLPENRLRTDPAMGFAYNLDTLWWKAITNIHLVSVTGTWGWPAIPDTVKQATIWTAAAFAENVRPVVTERVGDVSRTYATPLRDAIPSRAKDILEPYVRGRQ